MDITKLYQKQISLTEWFASVNHEKTEAMRIEDNDKRERLKVLNDIIGLPFDRPHQFNATELDSPTPAFRKFLEEHGHELCALRLIPKGDLPKLRMRGHSINEAMQWYKEQNIDPSQYKADFVPHAEESTWATIFVVNAQGIFGEIIKGGHHQLTQGFREEMPMVFSYDYSKLTLEPYDRNAEEHVKQIIKRLRVPHDKQEFLHKQLGAKFSHDYLTGYFETAASEEFGLWFIDYNRILGDMYEKFEVHSAVQSGLTGRTGSPGKAKGKVRMLNEDNYLEEGEILVCMMTTPEHVPLMKKAAAIVTELGGILSHAAIVAREMRKPCITGVADVTKLLHTGDIVEVDADAGIVKRL
jgi:phosphohistidine swiveling domain-containing protein